jgi:hypothetical protein
MDGDLLVDDGLLLLAHIVASGLEPADQILVVVQEILHQAHPRHQVFEVRGGEHHIDVAQFVGLVAPHDALPEVLLLELESRLRLLQLQTFRVQLLAQQVQLALRHHQLLLDQLYPAAQLSELCVDASEGGVQSSDLAVEAALLLLGGVNARPSQRKLLLRQIQLFPVGEGVRGHGQEPQYCCRQDSGDDDSSKPRRHGNL